MARFEIDKKHGITGRLEEPEVERHYRTGTIHLHSLCRQAGSPNWFRLDELFPRFKEIHRDKALRARVSGKEVVSSAFRIFLTVLMIVVLAVLFILAVRKISHASKGKTVEPMLASQYFRLEEAGLRSF